LNANRYGEKLDTAIFVQTVRAYVPNDFER